MPRLRLEELQEAIFPFRLPIGRYGKNVGRRGRLLDMQTVTGTVRDLPRRIGLFFFL